MQQLIGSVIIFLYGLLIGSFLNVCIYRIPLGKTIVKGRSYCPHCDALIPWYLNIPLISFLFLKGRCQKCKAPISLRYPAVELLTGILFLIVWFTYGFNWESLFVLILFSILVIISFIDIDLQIIPDRFIVILFVLGFIHAFYQTAYFNAHWYVWIIGLFSASLILFILGLIIPDSIGGGDIKLMAAVGLFTGPKLILIALFISALYALILSVFLLAKKKGSMKTAIPFGPFLSLGIITSVIFGERILNWYLSLFI